MRHAKSCFCAIVLDTKLPTGRELESTVHEDGVTSPGLGGEDPAILHDDLRIQRPPTARALLHHETRDIPGTRGQGLSSVSSQSPGFDFVPDGIREAHDSSRKYERCQILRPLFKRSRYGMPIIKCHANKTKKI